jgi:hypothetical protein
MNEDDKIIELLLDIKGISNKTLERIYINYRSQAK